MKIAAILFTFIVVAFSESTLSNTNILMPLLFDNRGIQYNLTAFDGCYSWTSSQPAFLAVHQLPLPDCQQSQASVTVLTNLPVNQIIWISATKENSNKELRVEATIDSIHRLEILTKQKVIDLDTFEELQIRAYDRDNNTFSTVEGIRFLWKSQSEDVKLVPLQESELQVSNTRLEVEKAGFHSDIMVVKGMRVGRSVIQVVILELKYSISISASVEIVVIEKFTLIPNRQIYYLPTHSFIRFDLYLIKAKYFKKIQLADNSYQWFVTSQVSKIAQNGVLTTQHIEQQHTLTIQNTTENSVSVFYVVVEPKSLGLEIIDNQFEESVEQQFYNNAFQNNVTALVVNREYTLKGYLRDSDLNYIYSQAKIKYDNQQGLIYAQDQIKSNEIRKGVIITVSDERLSTNAEIEFVNPIRVITPYEYIHLPEGEVYDLRIVEGSGQYEVFSKNVYIVQVNGARIKGVQVGKCLLVIRDRFNFYNQIQIEVIVTHMVQFFPLEKRKEVINSIEDKAYMIGQGMINEKLSNYTQCHSIIFTCDYNVKYNENLIDMKTSLRTMFNNGDQKFKQLLMRNKIEEIYDTFGVCSGVVLKHQISGEHILEINYGQQINIINLRVYDQMSMNFNKLILTPYSSYTIILNGGPRPWDSTIRDNLSKGIIKKKDYEYNVICGESENSFKLSKQNEATIILPGPKIMHLDLNIQCVLPNYFKIFNSENKEEIRWIYMGEQVDIIPEAYLDENSRFNNFSSLYLNWEANLPLQYNQGQLRALANGGNRGKLIINTQRYVDNYDRFSLIQSEFILSVYQPIKIIPENAILLVNQNKEFKIVDGSGNYECIYQGQKIDCGQQKIQIIAKNISSDWIEVKDLSIHSRTKAKVDVVNPDKLSLKIDQKYVILGKSVNSTVELKYGEHIFRQIEYSQIKLIAEVDKQQYQEIFILTPKNLGEHIIQANWNYILQSETQTLRTIPNVQANPSILYMTNGCTGFIKLTKYDYPFLEYKTNTQINGLQITIRENYILIDATNYQLKGNYSIIVQLINEKIEIDSITVTIVIGILNKVDIKYGGREIDLQSTVRLLAAPYINSNYPMCLCLCNFSFTWFIDDQEVLTAQDQYGYNLYAQKVQSLTVKVQVQGVSAETKIEILKPKQLKHNLYVNIQEEYKRPLLLPKQCTYKFESDITINPCSNTHNSIQISSGTNTIYATQESKIPTQITYQKQSIQFEVQKVYQIFIQQDILILKESHQLSVDLLNEQGQMFESCQEEQIQIVSYTPFIFDVKLSENTLQLKSKDLGKALLKVQYLKDPEIYNYLLVRVGAVIQPNQIEVFLGSEVQFSIPSPQPGMWQSNCGTFLNDVLTTSQEGECRVQYIETGFSYDGTIKVARPLHLEIVSTNKDGFLELEMSLRPFVNNNEKVKKNQKVECEVENKEWFEVYSTDDQKLICIIRPINSLKLNTPIQKYVKVNLKVSNQYFSVANTANVALEREIIIPQNIIELTQNNLIQTLKIPTYEQPNIHVDHSIIHFCTTYFDISRNEFVITINVSQQIQDSVEGRIWFLQNGQKLENKSILIRYDSNADQWSTMDLMLVASGLSIILLLILVFFVLIVYNYMSHHTVL